MKKIHKSIKGLKRQKEGQTYMQFKLQEERRENRRSNCQRYNNWDCSKRDEIVSSRKQQLDW